MEVFFWFVFWIIMATITAMVAASRGRSALGFFFYGLLIWPVALTHALISAKPVDASPNYIPTPVNGRAGGAFEPDGTINGKPYQAFRDGSILVLIDGRDVRFPDLTTAQSGLGGTAMPFKAR